MEINGDRFFGPGIQAIDPLSELSAIAPHLQLEHHLRRMVQTIGAP
ncbi:hypothetical protein N185_32840 [Sinorhizobium sp. GW3]|nr:hypothetical protein N185_32840 [Sinorhizobium sp. GW3]